MFEVLLYEKLSNTEVPRFNPPAKEHVLDAKKESVPSHHPHCCLNLTGCHKILKKTFMILGELNKVHTELNYQTMVVYILIIHLSITAT